MVAALQQVEQLDICMGWLRMAVCSDRIWGRWLALPSRSEPPRVLWAAAVSAPPQVDGAAG